MNEFKQALADHETQYGCWLAFANAYAAEIAATAGFDWLVIDAEHAPNDLRSVLGQLQAMNAHTSHPVVRLPEGAPALIKQYLDIGAQNLLIPMIENAGQAELMVRSMRYPPAGIRGVGAAIARASMWNKIPDYHQTVQEQLCLLLQVETATGVENLDDILAVEGIDGIFIGPADLAASMGYPDESSHPAVQEKIAHAVQMIRASGMAAGILATDTAMAREYLKHGVTFIAVGVDVLLFSQAMHGLAKSYMA